MTQSFGHEPVQGELMECAMDVVAVKRILPHRYPFLLVDRVLGLEKTESGSRVGQWAETLKNVSANEEFFEGHFPEHPIMPGVLVIEAMAQAGALAFYRESDPPMKFAIASVKESRFRSPIIPGDTLRIRAEILKDRGQMTLIRSEVQVEGKKVAESLIMASVVPR